MLRRAAALATAAVAAVALVALAGCSDDGRELAPPGPDQTFPPSTTSSTSVGDAAGGFALSSEAFADGDPIPERFSCFGIGVSPPLSWTGTPVAVELALVVRDRDADGHVHWIVTAIDPTITGFDEGGVPEGAAEQANTEGAIGWLPVCPPPGDERHVYDLVLHALHEPITVDPEAPAGEVAAQIEAAAAESARISGTYTAPADR